MCSDFAKWPNHEAWLILQGDKFKSNYFLKL